MLISPKIVCYVEWFFESEGCDEFKYIQTYSMLFSDEPFIRGYKLVIETQQLPIYICNYMYAILFNFLCLEIQFQF